MSTITPTTNINPPAVSVDNGTTQVTYDYVTAILIVPAFVEYIEKGCPKYLALNENQNDTNITVSEALTDTELTSLTTLVNNYVDPSVYYQLSNVDNFPMMTNYTSSTILSPVGSLIYSNTNSSNMVMNQVKIVIAMQCENTSIFTNASTGNVTFEILDKTRNVTIVPETIIDVSSILDAWSLDTTNNTTGYPNGYFTKVIQLYDFSNAFPDYDIILQFNVSSCQTDVSVAIECIQFLWYQVLTPTSSN
jgi:hypothetical protein